MKNVDRVALTRGRLLAAGRKLFAARGFAATSTDDILREAGVTRGALYHHFRDKTDLFEAICRELSEAAMRKIEEAVDGVDDPIKALEAGCLAWMDFVLRPEIRRLLIVEAPAVLGWQRWLELDEAHSFKLLREGIAEALSAGVIQFDGTAESIAVMLNGAINASVLRLSDGPEEEAAGRRSVVALVRSLAR
jgi:AcrR family transcriptional regulator